MLNKKNKTKTLSYRVEDRPANGDTYGPKKYRKFGCFWFGLECINKMLQNQELARETPDFLHLSKILSARQNWTCMLMQAPIGRAQSRCPLDKLPLTYLSPYRSLLFLTWVSKSVTLSDCFGCCFSSSKFMAGDISLSVQWISLYTVDFIVYKSFQRWEKMKDEPWRPLTSFFPLHPPPDAVSISGLLPEGQKCSEGWGRWRTGYGERLASGFHHRVIFSF